jgi:hypothetical protein
MALFGLEERWMANKKRGKARKRMSKSARGHKVWCAARQSKALCNCGAERRDG